MDIGGIAKTVVKGADDLSTSDEERDLIKKDIVLAELTQDDNYTKRARPTVVYSGIVVMILEMFGVRLYALGHIFEGEQLTQALNSSNAILISFLTAWGAVVGIYKFSRSQEKREKYVEARKQRFDKQIRLAEIKAEKKHGLFNKSEKQ